MWGQWFQNRALRICNLSSRHTSNSLHVQNKVLPIELRRKIDVLILLFKTVNRGKYSADPDPQTRLHSAPNLYISKPNSTKFLKSVAYIGPQLWTVLLVELRVSHDLNSFKTAVRALINQAFLSLSVNLYLFNCLLTLDSFSLNFCLSCCWPVISVYVQLFVLLWTLCNDKSMSTSINQTWYSLYPPLDKRCIHVETLLYNCRFTLLSPLFWQPE